MRHVAIFSDHWAPVEGGAEKQLRLIAESLVERGWSVHIVARATDDARPGHVRVVNARPRLRLLTDTVGQFRTLQPDVVVGSLISGVSMAGLATARAHSVPYVLRLGGPVGRFSAGRQRLFARAALRSCTYIVVNAEHLREDVQGIEPRLRVPVTVIPNGVPTSSAQVTDGRGPDVTVLFYTNGNPLKNEADFLEVVSRARTLQFRAVGATDSLPDLPNLRRLGWVQDLSEEFSRCDVVLNTSTFEGSPNFCLQGLSAGRPVAGFANEGLLELQRTYGEAVRLRPLRDTLGLTELLTQTDWRSIAVSAQVPCVEDTVDRWETLLTSAMRHVDR